MTISIATGWKLPWYFHTFYWNHVISDKFIQLCYRFWDLNKLICLVIYCNNIPRTLVDIYYLLQVPAIDVNFEINFYIFDKTWHNMSQNVRSSHIWLFIMPRVKSNKYPKISYWFYLSSPNSSRERSLQTLFFTVKFYTNLEHSHPRVNFWRWDVIRVFWAIDTPKCLIKFRQISWNSLMSNIQNQFWSKFFDLIDPLTSLKLTFLKN